MLKSIIILWFCHLSVDLFTGIWPLYKNMSGMDLATTGAITAWASFFGNGAQVFFGWLSDRGHRKNLIIFGLLLSSVACLYPYTESTFWLFVLVMGTYLGSSIFHPSATGLIGSISLNRKGLLVSFFITGGTIGLASSQLTFFKIYQWTQGQTLWLALMPCFFFVFVIFHDFKQKKVPPKKLKLLSREKFVSVHCYYLQIV